MHQLEEDDSSIASQQTVRAWTQEKTEVDQSIFFLTFNQEKNGDIELAENIAEPSNSTKKVRSSSQNTII